MIDRKSIQYVFCRSYARDRLLWRGLGRDLILSSRAAVDDALSMWRAVDLPMFLNQMINVERIDCNWAAGYSSVCLG